MNTIKVEDIARICFSLVVDIRRHNFLENELNLDETFDTISAERQQQLIKNIEHIRLNPDITAKEEHEIWAKLKINDGWKYGEVTDRENKIHACLVPYDELNFYQKLKDHLVIETVKMYYLIK